MTDRYNSDRGMLTHYRAVAADLLARAAGARVRSRDVRHVSREDVFDERSSFEVRVGELVYTYWPAGHVCGWHMHEADENFVVVAGTCWFTRSAGPCKVHESPDASAALHELALSADAAERGLDRADAPTHCWHKLQAGELGVVLRAPFAPDWALTQWWRAD